MGHNVKVSIIGVLDMLKFKNMSKVREATIQAAEPEEIVGEFAINQNAKALHPDYIEVVVDQIVDHAGAGAKSFILKKEDGSPLPYFRAGQYISLKLKIGDSFVTRAYSVSSAPKWALEGKYAITVKANPNGFAADWMLENFQVGTRLTISSPQGYFHYENLRDNKNVIALAGGSGITPFLSMAYAIRDGAEDFRLTILSGSRNEESILFREEFDKIQAATDKVKVVHVLSDEEKEGFEHGFITADLIQKYADGDYSVFICGPAAMYDFLKGELAKLDLPKRLIRSEAQGVTKKVWEEPGYPKKAKGKVFKLTVKQGADEYVIDASANEPVLVALERAGIKAPSRCRSGECGWCRSRLVSGDVYINPEKDVRRFADKKNGEIHPCVSFPVSDLVLEVPGEYFPE